jgi:type IV pili sensor histidine kinase/response regulator
MTACAVWVNAIAANSPAAISPMHVPFAPTDEQRSGSATSLPLTPMNVPLFAPPDTQKKMAVPLSLSPVRVPFAPVSVQKKIVVPRSSDVKTNFVSSDLRKEVVVPLSASSVAHIPFAPVDTQGGVVVSPQSSDAGTDITQEIPQEAQPSVAAWLAVSGQDLHQVAENWAQQAGYVLKWMPNYPSPYTYPIMADLNFRGKFISALTQLFNAYRMADRPFRVDIYKQQRLVVVMPASQ